MQAYSAGTAAPLATSPTKDHAKNAIKITAIMHIIGGSVITVMGCVAIGIKSYKSYIAAPLWTGLGVFLLAGLFGLFTHRGGVPRTCLISAYLGMSIASITCGFGIFVLNIVAAAHEELFGCVPFHYSWNCPTDDLARTLVDCALVLCGAFEIAVGITSTVAASYKLSCCRNSCCGGNGNAQQVCTSSVPWSNISAKCG
ncbi:uncharacterized protein [Diadema antillarum]|uniref:uncharacterized protein n=1 Tax=Diadema antillarum TaxID=105358 RepID=UPI003A8B888B